MSALDPVRSRATEGLAIEQIRARIERDLRPETLAHVHGTAGVARELALAHGLDPHRAELAALLHDVAHDYSDQELLRLAEQHRIPLSLTEARIPRLIHGWVGAAVLASEWGITDAELLDAVRFHISGSPTMGMLAKVVFVADKVEPHRSQSYSGLDLIRELAIVDLGQAVLKLYDWRLNDSVSRGAPVHEELSEARNILIERTRASRSPAEPT